MQDRKERLEIVERYKEPSLASYAEAVPEAIDRLSPEERRQVYAMSRLRAKAGSDGALEVSGVSRGDLCVCESESASTCWVFSTRPTPPFPTCSTGVRATSSSSRASPADAYLERTGQSMATKHALTAVAEGLRMDVGARGVRVINVEPGLVRTELPEGPFWSVDQYYADKQYSSIEAEDVAAAVLYAVEQQPHVSVSEILVRPTEQLK